MKASLTGIYTYYIYSIIKGLVSGHPRLPVKWLTFIHRFSKIQLWHNSGLPLGKRRGRQISPDSSKCVSNTKTELSLAHKMAKALCPPGSSNQEFTLSNSPCLNWTLALIMVLLKMRVFCKWTMMWFTTVWLLSNFSEDHGVNLTKKCCEFEWKILTKCRVNKGLTHLLQFVFHTHQMNSF